VLPGRGLARCAPSFLKAWDPVTKKARWSVELPGDGRARCTGGHLVFQGRIDGKLAAYDDRDGKLQWSFDVGAPVVAPPIAYSVGGKQYVTVLSGSGASGGGLFSAGDAQYPTEYRLPRRVLTFVARWAGQATFDAGTPLKAPADADYKPAPRSRRLVPWRSRWPAVSLPRTQSNWRCSAPDLRISPFPANREASTPRCRRAHY